MMTDRPKAEQLPLDLTRHPAMSREDFLEAPSNAVALAAVTRPGGLPAGIMVLIGPESAGKTHLARVWAAQTGAKWLEAGGLAEEVPTMLAEPGGLSAGAAVAIDDAAQVAGTGGEEALFHLVNHLRGEGQLLLTARQPVRDWGLVLPDLVSRLSAAAHVPLAEPDGVLLSAVLVKLFGDRQLRVQPQLIAYLLGRMERSFAAANDIVARLDARALELGRPVTRALAQEMFAEDLPTQQVLPLDLDNGGPKGAS